MYQTPIFQIHFLDSCTISLREDEFIYGWPTWKGYMYLVLYKRERNLETSAFVNIECTSTCAYISNFTRLTRKLSSFEWRNYVF